MRNTAKYAVCTLVFSTPSPGASPRLVSKTGLGRCSRNRWRQNSYRSNDRTFVLNFEAFRRDAIANKVNSLECYVYTCCDPKLARSFFFV